MKIPVGIGASRFSGIRNQFVRYCAATFASILVFSILGYGADVVLIRSIKTETPELHELEIASQFFGVDLRIIDSQAVEYNRLIDSAVRQQQAVAVAIEASALSKVNQDLLFRAARRSDGKSIPILILGITPDTNKPLLKRWSGGAVSGVSQFTDQSQLHYVVGQVAGVTQELSNAKLPFPGIHTSYFDLAEKDTVQEVMSVADDRRAVPVLVETHLGRQMIFLLSQTSDAGPDNEWNADGVIKAFAEVAPAMVFVKYCAGEFAWHSVNHYANLTIDDPWLREPYGYLSYEGLFVEMQQHNFHTTIAFIPWNYDRSGSDVVSLVRNHPERFSICLHGNNHDHQEFAESPSAQTEDIEQGVARMERFKALTQIPYDKVMIFPHNMGSETALEELKSDNFLATVNSSNVPVDRSRPMELLFDLRPVTLRYADFPSIIRYSAAMQFPTDFIAVNDFLGNPLFFYAHHDLFATGLGAFNSLADSVNAREPNTRWRSLGEIVKHLYLVRLRPDSNYDITAFSSVFELENSFGRDVIFYVKKQESGSATVVSVAVDGREVPFEQRDKNLDISIPAHVGETRTVEIRYKNDLNLNSVSVSKNSVRVYFLRLASDFRDITLSKYSLGGKAIHSYYAHDLSPRQAIEWAGISIAFCSLGALGLLFIVKAKSRADRKGLPEKPLETASRKRFQVISSKTTHTKS